MPLYERMIAELKKLNTQPDPTQIIFAGASAAVETECGENWYIWHDDRWINVSMEDAEILAYGLVDPEYRTAA